MKILFFDIDGTLVGKSKIPSEKTCSAVTRLKENGHLVFLCTGRSKNYIAHLLNLGFDGYIANAGACVMYRNKLIYARQLDPKLVRKTEEIFDRYDIPYDHECEDFDFIKEKMISDMFEDKDPIAKQEKIRRFLKENRTKPMEEYKGEAVYKISYTCDGYEQMKQAADELAEFYSIKINPAFAKITGDLLYEGVNKGEAIRQLISYLDLNIQDSIAFGDSMNDIEMLKACHTAIAMGNADETTRKYADAICESVEEDGIFYELKRRKLI